MGSKPRHSPAHHRHGDIHLRQELRGIEPSRKPSVDAQDPLRQAQGQRNLPVSGVHNAAYHAAC
ncbi:UNVERIFIED_CONTAM: hypothetical protein GTU68_042656 [Idotea baltica]|nr:hypothetical protein [Idotea baltica]